MAESESQVQDEVEVVVTTAKPAPDQRTKRQPPYVVVVLNDDFHSFEYVTHALSKICGHSLSKAFQLAVEIDSTGRAVVWSGTLELAELKRDQIKEFGPDHFASKPVTFPLGVYIEPLP
jgi:ATP-dependent Clp protease adaptor protein ClpS